MKYYPNTIGFLSQRIKKKYPQIKHTKIMKNMPGYLLWMMEELQSFSNRSKRGRWIGWIIAHSEILGLLSNKQSRKVVTLDVEEGKI
jgi:hypothetical protein